MSKPDPNLKSLGEVAVILGITTTALISWLDDNDWIVIGDSVFPMPHRIAAKDLVNTREGAAFTEQGLFKIRNAFNRRPAAAEIEDEPVCAAPVDENAIPF